MSLLITIYFDVRTLVGTSGPTKITGADSLAVQITSVIPNSSGTISVTSNPSGSGFQLLGPGLTHYNGATPATVSGLPLGNYTIVWDILLGGYNKPTSETKTLLSGIPLSFDATYAKPSPVTEFNRTPPYDFFNGCNSTNQLLLGEAIVTSDPLTGHLSVNVRSTGNGTATGQAGVGIRFTPTYTGLVRLRATIQIGPQQSFDTLTFLGLPIGTDFYDGGGGTIGSLVFIEGFSLQGPVVTGTTVFRTVNEHAVSNEPTLNPVDAVVPLTGYTHTYNPAQTFSAETTMAVSEGVKIGVCAGINSKVSTVSLILLPFFVMGKALYTASVLEFSIAPQQ